MMILTYYRLMKFSKNLKFASYKFHKDKVEDKLSNFVKEQCVNDLASFYILPMTINDWKFLHKQKALYHKDIALYQFGNIDDPTMLRSFKKEE